MAQDTDKILKVEELAKFFGVSRKTVWEWCKQGKLPAFKIGKEWKIRQSDLQKVINQKIVQPQTSDTLFSRTAGKA
jgi:excisionase family DNA binding protein